MSETEKLQVAAAYILTLRQLVYARDPEVVSAAKERVDREGSRWYLVEKELIGNEINRLEEELEGGAK